MADNNLLNNINPNFFEGVEKLLEIWFAPAPSADLRKIPRYILVLNNLKNSLLIREISIFNPGNSSSSHILEKGFQCSLDSSLR